MSRVVVVERQVGWRRRCAGRDCTAPVIGRAVARVVALAGCFVLVFAVVPRSLGAAGPIPGARANRGAGPGVALGMAVQRVVGVADRSFRVVRRGHVMVGSSGRVSSVFSRSGVRLKIDDQVVGIRLTRIGYGVAPRRAVRSVAPVVSGSLVRFRRGGVVEWYRNGPLGLEQGFMLSRPLVGHPVGPFTLVLALNTSLEVRRVHGGVSFLATSGLTMLRYGALKAVDASGRRLRSTLTLSRGRVLIRVWDSSARYPLVIDPLIQPAVKLVGDCTNFCSGANGTGEVSIGMSGGGQFGISVAMSGDGTTALVGAWGDNQLQGAAWVFTRSGSAWSQQGPKLIGDCTDSCSGPAGNGESGQGGFGVSVALSADGNTALIGAQGDRGNAGAAWVFTRSGSAWSQQGPKLIGDCTGSCSGPNGTGETIGVALGGADFGVSVALSADGNTALIGGRADGGEEQGAAWVFTRSGSAWGQQGAKLVGDCTRSCSGPNGTGEIDTDGLGGAGFGSSVALAADGNTALIGAPGDGAEQQGAAWVFTRSGSLWSQQGAKLVGDCTRSCSGPNGTGEISNIGNGGGAFGASVALAGSGGVAVIGAPGDDGFSGAAWVFTRAVRGWSQQGSKLIADCTALCSGPRGVGEAGAGAFGISVTLSQDGNTVLIGAWEDRHFTGAAWVFTRKREGWSQLGAKLVAARAQVCPGPGRIEARGCDGFGSSVALTHDGYTLLIGALGEDAQQGAAWVLTRPRPSNQFSIVHVHADHNGRVTLAVTLPGPGTVDVLETAWKDNVAAIVSLLQPAPRRFTVARARATALRAGTVALSVVPNLRGRHLVLHHTYRVTLRLWVTYKPLGAPSRSIGIYGLHLSAAR